MRSERIPFQMFRFTLQKEYESWLIQQGCYENTAIIVFLDECYEAEHQLSLSDAVDDLSVICKRNGGGLG
ncbi:DUF3791 domain-containing protein [uncultured Parabacteroides sp.]|uniref:DUF3791 domain-containing protein n=1 Tax=uncultured Parabacteroides sp. TaxID=512312 RepID=UPI0025E94B53|nr:DUF3791 domain-containing protein [uncultured Parabacteroides sp.]